MILQTGGFALGEISTRSKSFSSASLKASSIGTIPRFLPVSSIRRHSLTLICLFTLNS